MAEYSPENKANEKILEEAKARFDLAQEAFRDIKRDALEDLEFAAGDQWDKQVEQVRKQDRRPCFTINRLPQHIKQVTNDQRQNRPSIKVHPVDDKGDPETAEIFQGLIRHIEYNSNADAAYDTAFEFAARAGLGFYRVITDYVSPLSFEQEILIKRIRNPLSVSFDPFSTEPDGSDAEFAFIEERLSKDTYERLYPDSELSNGDVWESVGNSAPDWMGDKGARVVEYFYKEWKEETLVQLSDGQVMPEEDAEQYIGATAVQSVDEFGVPMGEPQSQVEIVAKRKTKIPTIKWCKLNACEILEETEWPGSFIPIVPVYGEELDINGKRILKGIVRDAKDPQRLFNYWKSAEAEAIALAPKSPYIADAKSIEGYEDVWATANTRNHSYLPFDSTKGPMPQRNSIEPAVMAITQAALGAAEEIKATTGIYDASLGARSNETSGVAIQRRNVQAQTSNFHFVDNLTRSQRHTGRILLDLIPKIYDTSRAARILGEDGEPEIIRLNEVFQRKGKQVLYDLSAGKYDCTVDVGPSFASKRQEAAQSMLEMSKANPALMGIAGDLIVKNMDWPGSQEVADRIKKTLPPPLQEGPEGQDIPPQVQAQMQQMSQMVEQLTGKLNELQSEREQKLIELESKERIEMKKLEVEVELKLAELDQAASIKRLDAELAQIEQRMSLLKQGQPISYGGEEQFEPQPDGGIPADVGMEQIPTGGESPGTPIGENDDPNRI